MQRRTSSGFGPSFQGIGSRLYRAEYAAASVVILSYLLWKAVNGGGVDWLQTIFWGVFPDLASFIPIAASSQRKEWPSWGANLYNFFHTILIWGALFAASWLVLGSVYLPLLGWLLHITADRAVGYYLRQTGKSRAPTT